ncbi:MAG: PEP-CTERM sorting domain-containing protein [Pseudomonadota bacterium]
MIKSIKTTVLGAVASLVAATTTQAAIISDIVFVIDDSVSMANDINQVRQRIVQFNTAMVNAGIDANYGLVSFGGPGGRGGAISCSNVVKLQQDVTSFGAFNAPGGAFQSLGAPCQPSEPGSEATLFAMNNLTFRTDSIINTILITDEDDDSSQSDFLAADAALAAKNALFNYIGRPGVGTTNARYGVLAANHGGQAFDIRNFRSDPDPFFANFIDTKVQEIIDTCDDNPNLPGCTGGGTPVSEPGTIGLIGFALFGLGVYARRRRKA